MLRRLSAAVACAALVLASCTSDDAGDGAAEPTADPGDERTYEATIVRTAYNVPHITGATAGDAAFGQGYASGEDHACSLADQVVKLHSERARWHGAGEEDRHLNSDLAWLHLELIERAERDLAELGPEAREVLDGFVAGWNQHLADVGVDGLAGWCAGEPWVRPITALDVYAHARATMLLASSGALIDFIATAQPPGADQAEEGDADSGDGEEAAAAPTANPASWGLPDATQHGSNGWALGSERAEGASSMLLANPHFPWDGELRFWESHLTVPGELDIYGAQLLGLPGIGIGFNDHVAWTHTVSAGNRFTAYRLELAEGDPTSYIYDGEPREMEAVTHTVEVLGEDGSAEEETRTLYRTHWGPVIDFPGLGWTADVTITYRDANIDNTAFFDQYLGMNSAAGLDELITVHEEHAGIPLFNTLAVGADGRAWYADTSATPKLSDEALEWWEQAREEDPMVSVAFDNGAVLLEGNDSTFEWVEVEGARDPGLVPFDEMPQLVRDDYVFNANDSYWLANASELLAGPYSPLHGLADTVRSVRTRENVEILEALGAVDLAELREAALVGSSNTARNLLAEVVARCEGAGEVALEASEDGVLPAATVSVAEACEVLAGWDGTYQTDSVGAVVWRELLARFPREDFLDASDLYAVGFDPSDPVGTPTGLAAPAGEEDPLLVNLARAVQVLEEAGVALDAALGEVQVAVRAGERIGVPGGTGPDGVTNMAAWGPLTSSTEPGPERPEPVAGGWLTPDGYWVNVGTSFLLAVAFTEEGPVASALLTYGNTGDPDDPEYTAQTELFGELEWRDVLFDPEEIAADPERREYTVSG